MLSIGSFGRMGAGSFSRADVAYIDIDHGRPPAYRQLCIVARALGLGVLGAEYERTRRGWHVKLYLRERLHAAELVALQAICGSDARREMLNLMRCLSIRRHGVTPFWSDRWNILYDGKVVRDEYQKGKGHRPQRAARSRQRTVKRPAPRTDRRTRAA